jgi:sec-independent protein translocase protein TatA
MDFFGIGFGELVLILIVALIIFGPGRLPEVARTLGRMSRNLKRMSSDFTSAMTKEIGLEEERESLKKASSDINATITRRIDIEDSIRSHLGPDKPPKEAPSATPSVGQVSNPTASPTIPPPEDHD